MKRPVSLAPKFILASTHSPNLPDLVETAHSPTLHLGQIAQLFHIRILQPNRRDVLLNPSRVGRFGDDGGAALNCPRNEDLADRDVVFGGEGGDHRVVAEAGLEVLAEGAVGLADDGFGFAVGNEFVLADGKGWLGCCC